MLADLETMNKLAARIASLESALAKAEEALNSFQEDHGCCPTCGRYIEIGGHTKGCLYGDALAAIRDAKASKETHPSGPQGCAATDQREGV